MGKRIKIAVGADPLIHESAQKRIHRPIVRLAQDIPAGDLKPGERTHHRKIRPLRETRGISPTEHQFNVLWILARHMTREHILNHGAHRLRTH